MTCGQYLDLVPRDFDANLRWREQLLLTSQDDCAAQEELWIMCARDPLFWMDSFAWTSTQKDSISRSTSPIEPWICYDYQVEDFPAIFDALGQKDLVNLKSRQMGATWAFLLTFLWSWLFESGYEYLLISRNENYVDSSGNKKAMFQRLDFVMEYLPGWMLPTYTRTKLRLTNHDSTMAIVGESTTSDAARGGDFRAVFIDEYAAFDVNDGYRVLSATQSATDCRIYNSTFQGTGNAFYEVTETEGIAKVYWHWSKHPQKSEGLYFTDEPVFGWTDPAWEGKKPRSPWYDKECARAVHQRVIAQELDMDPMASDTQFFDPKVLAEIRARDICKPLHTGELDYDVQTLRPFGFEKRAGGRFALWTEMGVRDEPPPGHYIVGADIATGTGNSNSVLSIGNADTNEQVAEWVCCNIRPEEFAKLAIAVCRWFKTQSGKPAFLIPEANGPGRQFIDVLMENGFRNIFMRETEGKLRKRRSDQPGWWASKETKKTLLGDYRRALADSELTLRSYDQVRECADYIFSKTGTIVHSGSISDLDPSGARENHGDRPTAGALMWKGMARRGVQKLGPVEVPLGCFEYWRRKRRVKAQQQKSSFSEARM